MYYVETIKYITKRCLVLDPWTYQRYYNTQTQWIAGHYFLFKFCATASALNHRQSWARTQRARLEAVENSVKKQV